jgi:Putative Actinobacterial Holin-X, holin superfamily III
MIASAQEQRRSPLSGVISSATEVAGDFVELAELQLELAKADANKFVSRSIPPIGGLLACSVILLVCLPVGLLGLADILATQFELDLGVTRLAIGFVGGLIALGVLAICLRQLKSGLTSFTESQSQLRQNLIWLKEMIRRQ